VPAVQSGSRDRGFAGWSVAWNFRASVGMLGFAALTPTYALRLSRAVFGELLVGAPRRVL
jgi:hypothetical protein